MAAKPVFTKEQHRLIQQAAVRVWEGKFKGKDKQPQKKMALALGITQQSVSNLLRGRYRPGIRVAEEIALLDDHNALEELVGPYGREAGEGAPAPSMAVQDDQNFKNLGVCVQFFAATKHWSPWTIAAARAGFFGNADFAPPEWVPKLDQLEKALERARK